jgi:Protein of unknown function (DUF2510)
VTETPPTPLAAPLAPRGWYADPERPSVERWWTGAEWSNYRHRRPGPLSFDPRYTRSYWIGPNSDAGKARNCTQIGGILLLAAVVVACLIGARAVFGAGWEWVLLAALAVSGLLHIGGIIFGRRGLSRADTLGARGASLSSVVVSSIELIVCACGILVLVLILALARG